MTGNGFKVLFIYPNSRRESIVPPAITLLSRILKNHGYQTDLFDSTGYEISEHGYSDKKREEILTVKPSPHVDMDRGDTDQMHSDLRKKVAEFSPDLIAVSSTEVTFRLALTILAGIRDFDVPVLLGGVFATFAPELALRFEDIDMVCVGEGERVMLELVRAMESGKNYSHLQGLWVKGSDGEIVKNLPAPPTDLNENPVDLDVELFPEWRLYRPMSGELYRTFPVETIRGCPYRCGFCNTPSQHDLYREAGHNFFRKKRMDRVREEMAYYMRYSPQYMYFWADTFLAMSTRELDEFCEVYEEFRLPFWIQTRPETITRERLQKLKRVGLHRMSVGIEQGNEKFRQDVLVRPYSNAEAIEALKIPVELGIPFSTFNMVGLPDETPELHWDTVLLNREIKSDTTNLSTFTPFVGTPLRDLAIERGYMLPDLICSGTYEETVLDMPQFPRDVIDSKKRVFVMYVKFPESRWPEIKKAEERSPEGDALWQELRKEFIETYYDESKQATPHE